MCQLRPAAAAPAPTAVGDLTPTRIELVNEAARSDPGILPSSSFRLELDQLQIHHHRPLRLVGWLVRNESSRWRGLMRTAAFGFLPA
jgi:hypothetical protein